LVNDAGQLYTIEGVAAAILLLVTVYIVLGTTTIYTPGDSHISDLQLEQLGNDALAMMDTPTQYIETGNVFTAKQSDLEKYIMTSDNSGLPKDFNTAFLDFLNVQKTGADRLNYKAVVWYRRADGTLGEYDFMQSALKTGREKFVRVTRLVTLKGRPINNSALTPPIFIPGDMRPDPIAPNPNFEQTVLLDVIIWRS
jgi:hypothetical protein